MTLGGAAAVALIDSGASHNFVSSAFAVRHRLSVSSAERMSVRLATGVAVDTIS